MKIRNPLRRPFLSLGLLLLLLICVYQSYRLIDQGFLTSHRGIGHVKEREYKPMSVKTYTTKVGSSATSHSVQTPEAWLLHVEMGGVTGQIAVSQSIYELSQDGEPVEIFYSKRRLSGILNIDSLHLFQVN